MSKEISDRTTRFVKSFLNARGRDASELFSSLNLCISGNEEILKGYNGQVMILALVNLLGRFHPHITSAVPSGIENQIWVPFGYDKELSNCLRNVAEEIGSYIESTKSQQKVDILISVGATDITAEHKITINSDGWLSFVAIDDDNKIDLISDNKNAIGALIAACFGAAEAFRRLLEALGSTDRRIRSKYHKLIFSTLDYSVNNLMAPNPQLPEEIDIKDMVVVGAGAVANSLILALNTIPELTGMVTILDDQTYDASNINRCIMASRANVGVSKAASIASSCSDRIRAISSQDRYESFRRTQSKLDLVASTIDENEPRITIQSDLPRVLFHGATGDEIATISRHNFIDRACLGCLFSESTPIADSIARETGLPPEEVTFLLESSAPLTAKQAARIAEKTGVALSRLEPFVGLPLTELYTHEICGAARIKVQQEEIAATVSFVSALPGILLAGEAIKERVDEFGAYRLNNYLTLSLFNPSSRWLLIRPKDERCKCLCSHPIMRERYAEKWFRQE